MHIDTLFFSSPKLVKVLQEQRIYYVGKVRTNRNQMPTLSVHKNMKRGKYKFVKCKISGLSFVEDAWITELLH